MKLFTRFLLRIYTCTAWKCIINHGVEMTLAWNWVPWSGSRGNGSRGRSALNMPATGVKRMFLSVLLLQCANCKYCTVLLQYE